MSAGNGQGFVCSFPGCGRVFTRQQGLTRHYGYEHEGKRPSLPRATPPPPEVDLEELGVIDVPVLSAPLYEAIAGYEERLKELRSRS